MYKVVCYVKVPNSSYDIDFPCSPRMLEPTVSDLVAFSLTTILTTFAYKPCIPSILVASFHNPHCSSALCYPKCTTVMHFCCFSLPAL